jgi:hypothetical protein
LLTIGKPANLQPLFLSSKFSELFCGGKLAVKRGFATPCYPMCMEMFLIAALIALLAVLILDTRQKRQAFLCQREETTKPHHIC